jgi:hypothetical protein
MYYLDYTSPLLTPYSLNGIIDLCFQESACFSLIFHSCPEETNELITELFKYRYRRIRNTHWFCYDTMEYNLLEAYIYPDNCETQAIVEKYYSGLFLDNLSDKTLE